MMYIVEKLEVLHVQDIISHCLITTAHANSQAIRYIKANDINTFIAPMGAKYAIQEVRKYAIGASITNDGHGLFHVDWNLLDRGLQGKEDRIEA